MMGLRPGLLRSHGPLVSSRTGGPRGTETARVGVGLAGAEQPSGHREEPAGSGEWVQHESWGSFLLPLGQPPTWDSSSPQRLLHR